MRDIGAFLVSAGWDHARHSAVPSDAGDRRYSRLIRRDGRTAILMQSPVATSHTARVQFDAFCQIGTWLRQQGLNAPEEYAADARKGLMLLEDFGDISVAGLLAGGAADAQAAYLRAVDVLAVVAQASAPKGLAEPGPGDIAGMLAPLTDRLGGDTGLDCAVRDALTALPRPGTVALRDIHGDNLMWLPERVGLAQVGLLDFQDALKLPNGYDIASLFDDPRRTVPEDWRSAGIDRYARATGQSVDDLTRRVALLSLVRNLRILGLFRGFAEAAPGVRYARFIPRTRDLIERASRHPDLGDLRGPVREVLHLTAPWADVAP